MMKGNQGPEKILKAGALLGDFLAREARGEDVRHLQERVIEMVYDLLDEAYVGEVPKNLALKADALRSAVDALKRHDEGKQPVMAIRNFYDAVQAHELAPQISEHGNPSPHGKQSTRTYWIRALLLILWDKHPNEHKQLSEDAKRLLNLRDRDAVRQLVANDRRRCDDGKGNHPIAPQLSIARKEISAQGSQKLDDYL